MSFKKIRKGIKRPFTRKKKKKKRGLIPFLPVGCSGLGIVVIAALVVGMIVVGSGVFTPFETFDYDDDNDDVIRTRTPVVPETPDVGVRYYQMLVEIVWGDEILEGNEPEFTITMGTHNGGVPDEFIEEFRIPFDDETGSSAFDYPDDMTFLTIGATNIISFYYEEILTPGVNSVITPDIIWMGVWPAQHLRVHVTWAVNGNGNPYVG